MARRFCTVSGCDRPAHGHGLCQNHYKASKRLARGLKPPGYPAWQTKAQRDAQLLRARRKAEGLTDPRALERRVGACEICGRHCDPLCLDHCHATGQIRGWLCRQCNAGIGQLGDDLASIERARSYLLRFEGLTNKS